SARPRIPEPHAAGPGGSEQAAVGAELDLAEKADTAPKPRAEPRPVPYAKELHGTPLDGGELAAVRTERDGSARERPGCDTETPHHRRRPGRIADREGSPVRSERDGRRGHRALSGRPPDLFAARHAPERDLCSLDGGERPPVRTERRSPAVDAAKGGAGAEAYEPFA